MDNLTQRALNNQNNASAAYNDKQRREVEQQTLTEAPAFVTGFAGGKYLVERLGQEPTATGVPVTNGLLQTGQRVTTTGQFVDGMPRVKPVVPAVKVVETTGKIKYLYSIISAGKTVFYVGGWQQKSVMLKTFDSSYTILSASLDNLGGNKWSANFSYQKEGKYYVEFKPSSGEGWFLESPVPATSYGHGFWRADNQTRNDSGALRETSGALRETDFWYAWKNNTVTQHKTTYDLFSSGSTTYFASGNIASEVGGGYDRAIYDLIFLPLDEDVTGKTFPYCVSNTNTRSASYSDVSPFPLTAASSACTSEKNINALLKIDAQGLVGVGTNTTYNASESAGLNQPYGGCQLGTTYTYSTRYTADGEAISTDTTNLAAYDLDVFSSVITGIKRSPDLYTGISTERNKKVEVSTFNSAFQQSQKQYSVFKPSILGDSFMFRSASYHP